MRRPFIPAAGKGSDRPTADLPAGDGSGSPCPKRTGCGGPDNPLLTRYTVTKKARPRPRIVPPWGASRLLRNFKHTETNPGILNGVCPRFARGTLTRTADEALAAAARLEWNEPPMVPRGSAFGPRWRFTSRQVALTHGLALPRARLAVMVFPSGLGRALRFHCGPLCGVAADR
jgi:hypothetical protein